MQTMALRTADLTNAILKLLLVILFLLHTVSMTTTYDATESSTTEHITTGNITTSGGGNATVSPSTVAQQQHETTATPDGQLDSYAIAAIVISSIVGVLIIALIVGKVVHSRMRSKRSTNVSSENLKDAENESDKSDKSVDYSRNVPVHFTNCVQQAGPPVSNGSVKTHPSLAEGPPAGSTHMRDIPTDIKEFLLAFLEPNTAHVVNAKLRLAEEDDIDAEASDLIPHASVLLDADLQDQAKSYFTPDSWRVVKTSLKNLEAMINDNTLKHSKAIDTQIGTYGKGKGKGKSSRSVSRSNSLQSLEQNNNENSPQISVQHM